MTKLITPVSRETKKQYQGRPVIVTLAPAGSNPEALVALRLKGQRTQYVLTVSDLYRLGALWHGQREAAARKRARRDGIPWREAKRQFDQANRLP